MAPDAVACDDCLQARKIARSHSLPTVNLGRLELDPKVVQLVPRHEAIELEALPINQYDSTVVVAMASPSPTRVKKLEAITNLNVEPVVATRQAITAALYPV